MKLADTDAAEQEKPSPHAFQDDGDGTCKICGEGPDADIHGASKASVDAAAGDAETSVAAEPALTGGKFQAKLFTEGTMSRDGRMIAKGASFWGDGPLTLMGLVEDTGLGGHSGSQVSGSMTALVRVGDDIVATGTFDASEWGTNIERLVRDMVMTGISVDLAPTEWQIEASPVEEEEAPLLLLADGEADTAESHSGGDREVVVEEKMDDMVFVVTKGEIMGATVCPMPAFADAEIHLTASGQPERITLYGSIEMMPENKGTVEKSDLNPIGYEGAMIALYPEPYEAEALANPDGLMKPESLHCTLFYFPELDGTQAASLISVVKDFAANQEVIEANVGGAAVFTPSADSEEPGAPEVLLVKAPGFAALRSMLAARLDDAQLAYSTKHDFIPHITTNYDDPSDFSVNADHLDQPLTFRNISFVAGSARDDYPLGTNSLTASAMGLAVDRPPIEWFEDPQLDGPTALTIKDGRVFGHAATWNVCHVGHSNQCITAPRSQADYGYFMLGELETAEGERVAVGQITLDTGHASDKYGQRRTREHYDNTGTAVADVVVGEDEHGIWMAGAVRPDATAGVVRKFQGAKISGDWRDVNGHLELVALLAVNVPGFPIPRPKAQLGRTRGGGVKGLALVAAGIVGEYEVEKAPPPTRAQEDISLRLLLASVQEPEWDEDTQIATLLSFVE